MSKSVTQYSKVLMVFLAKPGEVISKEELEGTLGKEIVFARISTYIWDIKKRLGGVVKSVKVGKKVTGYILTNPEKFNAKTMAPSAPVISPTPATVASIVSQLPKKSKPAPSVSASAKKTPSVKNVSVTPLMAEPRVKIGEVPSYSVDGDFDSFNIEDII